MTLEELLQAMNLAVAEAAKDPKNEDLKTKAEFATKQYNDAKELSETNPEAPDESKFDEQTKAYIAKLRKENATHRTTNKDLKTKYQSEVERSKAILKAAGIETESDKPEEKLKALTAESQQHAFRNAVLESALQHGVPGDQIDYYEFLIAKKTNELEEGEELSDDELAKIVATVKKTGTKATSTVTTDGKGGQPAPGTKSDKVTFEQFLQMGVVQKSALFISHPEMYNGFVAEAKAKKKSLI